MVSVTKGQSSAFSKRDDVFFKEMADPKHRAKYESFVLAEQEKYQNALEMQEYYDECARDAQDDWDWDAYDYEDYIHDQPTVVVPLGEVPF
jgi:hypothetical protein